MTMRRRLPNPSPSQPKAMKTNLSKRSKNTQTASCQRSLSLQEPCRRREAGGVQPLQRDTPEPAAAHPTARAWGSVLDHRTSSFTQRRAAVSLFNTEAEAQAETEAESEAEAEAETEAETEAESEAEAEAETEAETEPSGREESEPCQKVVILLSTRSAGVGLNLSKAQKIMFAEPVLNRKMRGQCVGRILRIDQRKSVQIMNVLTCFQESKELQLYGAQHPSYHEIARLLMDR